MLDHPGYDLGGGADTRIALGAFLEMILLVPRRLAILGLIGGPPVVASGTAVLFGVIEPGSVPQASRRCRRSSGSCCSGSTSS